MEKEFAHYDPISGGTARNCGCLRSVLPRCFCLRALEAALPLPEIPDAPGGRAPLVTIQNFCRPMKVVTTKTLFFYHRVFDESNDCHDDGSAYSTTRDTADDTLQIGASSSGHANSQSLKDARTGAATEDARYGVA